MAETEIVATFAPGSNGRYWTLPATADALAEILELPLESASATALAGPPEVLVRLIRRWREAERPVPAALMSDLAQRIYDTLNYVLTWVYIYPSDPDYEDVRQEVALAVIRVITTGDTAYYEANWQNALYRQSMNKTRAPQRTRGHETPVSRLQLTGGHSDYRFQESAGGDADVIMALVSQDAPASLEESVVDTTLLDMLLDQLPEPEWRALVKGHLLELPRSSKDKRVFSISRLRGVTDRALRYHWRDCLIWLARQTLVPDPAPDDPDVLTWGRVGRQMPASELAALLELIRQQDESVAAADQVHPALQAVAA